MKRYRNSTNSTIAIDCMSYTRYLKPGEIATLPNSRDVRYNARLRKLILIKESLTQRIKPKRKKRKYKKRATKKKVDKTKNKKQKETIQEKMEIDNGAES